MRILLSGFEPFGGLTTNPTLELIERAKLFNIEGIEIDTIRLPVVYQQCVPPLIAKIAEINPDIVVCLGVAVGRASVNLERIGINVQDTVGEGKHGDNQGDHPIDRPIINDGPAGLFSTLPIRLLFEELQKMGIPTTISNTAGTYICNTTLYSLLHHIEQSSLEVEAGFIHVPATPEMVLASPQTASMSIETQAKAIRLIIEILGKYYAVGQKSRP
ncbi:pyroglutamyl-peptidase I [Salipaludibacillus sp. HK11]|uniref:pyroglutamyl-peptidase I n=1 Tax=Salipaludibacillus sp. HK11 TaxID=3394320 RepID=UPI0039FC472F